MAQLSQGHLSNKPIQRAVPLMEGVRSTIESSLYASNFLYSIYIF